MFKAIKQFFSNSEVQQRSKIAEDTLYGRANYEADTAIAEATARLAEAFCRTNSPGVVDTSTFLFVKVPDENGQFRIWSKRLTVDDRIALDENPGLANHPSEVIRLLGLSRTKVLPDS